MGRRATKPRRLRIELVPTERTDLICISCGGFRTDLEVKRFHDPAMAGLHSSCINDVRVTRGAA